MSSVTGKLRTVKCPNCGQRKTIFLEEFVGRCPNCESALVEDPNTSCEESLSILNEASKIINGERQDSYGVPEDSFQIIASFWTTYLGHKDMITEGSLGLSALDVAHMMTLFKIARMLGQKPARDNYRDACGYLAIAADRLLRQTEPFDPEEL